MKHITVVALLSLVSTNNIAAEQVIYNYTAVEDGRQIASKSYLSFYKQGDIHVKKQRIYVLQANGTYTFDSTLYQCFVGYPNDPREFGGKNGTGDWYNTKQSLTGCKTQLALNAQNKQ